ncbi:hypothetical protein ACNKXS_03635 [Christiangramia marina]|uniref:hypothetical protein n=1 Tax=Christiangramia marina TaxID=409436 RepID=UPI003AA9A1A2
MIDSKTRDLSRSFFDLMEKEKIGRFEVDRKMNLQVFTLTMQEIRTLLEKKVPFLDGTKGGLIIGEKNNFHGGIYLIRPYFVDGHFQNKFFLYAEVQPGDYISSVESCSTHVNRYIQLENSIENFTSNIKSTSRHSNKIDTSNHIHSFIFLDQLPQMIFSNATFRAHGDEIIDLDQ